MIKMTLEFAVLVALVSLALIIALALILKTLFPVLIIGVVYFLYKHNKKDKPQCPECEVRQKVDSE